MTLNYVTRIAPTPSGYLHLGNLFNFRLIQLFAKKAQAKLILRIDDIDSARVRDDYIEDIFKHIAWMKIPFDQGPSSISEFKDKYSQQNKISEYFQYLKELEENGCPFYNCQCSRKEYLKISKDGLYPGTCRDLELKREQAPVCRINTKARNDLNINMGDFVIWRRNNEPSYQLMCAYEDKSMGVNFVIRGEDLLHSTLAQQYLLSFRPGPTQDIRYFHHPLLKNQGEKLSKSQKNAQERQFYARGESFLNSLDKEWRIHEQLDRLFEYLERK